MPDLTLRLTTDAAISFIDEYPLFWSPVPSSRTGRKPDRGVSQVGKKFYERTNDYWREWCRYLSIPFDGKRP